MSAAPAPRRIDRPAPGFFKLALVRRGPMVAARITNQFGFWGASINGQSCGARHPDPFVADGVSRIWEHGTAIAMDEYEALLRHPPLTPTLAIDLHALPPVTFEATAAMSAARLEPAAIGHNNPPVAIDLHAALEPRALKAWIAQQLAPHEERAGALLARYLQFLPATAAGIKSDAIDERAVDFAEQIRAEINAIDATRIAIKAPVLAATRAIDGAAKAISDGLQPAFTEVKARHTAFLLAKDAEIRRVAAEAAARAEAEAYELSRQAEATGEDAAFEAAGEAIVQQQTAEAIVAAPVLELTRMRTANGVSSGLRDNWTYAVADIAAVPAHFLVVNDAAVRAAIKGGTRHIPGLTIRNEPRAR